MVKIIAAITLSLSLIFLAKESIVALRGGGIPAPPVSEDRQARPQAAYPAERNVIFYPPVPIALPDFNKGYLFNEERSIESAADGSGDGSGEDTASLSVDMDAVFYAGSIIIGEIRKGLVAYPSPRATVLNRKITTRQAAPQDKERNYAQLAVGENFSGYTVAEVEADRIVFQKGSETIEKMLIDPKKSRITPPPLPKAPGKTPAAAPAQTNRVQLDKARSSSPVQSTRTVRGTTRMAPQSIQVPGVPAPPATE
ncbi:MAG: hypothetical protein C4531_04815 [Desulfurivibrio sp.]|nr:MAG: hypothetical protein C4531_04815 [Desulfurivibrio sp.]